jgi:glucose/arabinose dehydrogenase
VVALACAALAVGLAPARTTAVDPSPPAAPDRPRLDRAGTDRPDPVPDAVFADPNFQEEVVFSGLVQPIVVDFASDGRVFVGEKSGIIKVFDSVSDPTASIWADLRTNVHNYWDRGLLGLAVDPDFASNGRVYVAYTHNAPIGGTAPYWPDDCPNPPGGGGSGDDGCVASGRVSAITAGGAEQVLVEDWCQQFASHSMSDIVFDLEGALIVNGGDGANFNTSDYGQLGGQKGDPAGAPGPVPENPCGDPPAGVGGNMELPTAQGGALRAQDVRTTADPTGLSGSVIRIDKMTGAAMPDNPAIGSADPNTRRIIAHGLRNPFRMAVHPVSNELWIGDVGWGTWEEINRHSDPDGAVRNFGWPCREGTSLEPGLYPQANLCISMATWTNPVLQYCHNQAEPGCADHEVVNGDGCGGGGAISGLAFYAGGGYPDTYDNALFFADYTRDCIWVMTAGVGGVPDPATTAHFATASVPVHLTTGPGGDLFYVDIGGSIRRIRYLGANEAPNAVAEADPASGSVPLAVDFDATNSSDPDGDPLTYAWDFDEDGDGLFNDATGATPSNTYESPGTYVARVRVSDGHGGTDIDTVTIDAGNNAPTATITQPSATLRWSVDEEITFAGTATDPDEGTLPPSAMTWNLIMVHCATTCHEHPIATFSGVSGGTFDGPDHEYPSHLLLRLTVEDSDGGSDVAEVELQPKTVALSLQSDPPGLEVTAGWRTDDAPFSMTVISGSAIDLNAPSTEVVDGFTYTWASWSDGQARTHTVHPTANATYRATFSGGFDDVPPGAPFGPDIAWLVDNGITAGCSSVPALYCPTSPVTRWQMALFLDRALDLPPTATDFFVDDEGSPYEAAVNRLAAAGITNGCGPGRFCPTAIVLREQMASFLARALDLPATGGDFFTDDAGSVHEDDINRLAEAGITNGCAPGRFCPTSPVARNEMAAFLHRAIEAPLP